MDEDDNVFIEMLPDWAAKFSSGRYLEEGAQLCTRDGRKCGNAVVAEVLEDKPIGSVAKVVTDSGNVMELTLIELNGLFFAPKYVMSAERFTGEGRYAVREEGK